MSLECNCKREGEGEGRNISCHRETEYAHTIVHSARALSLSHCISTGYRLMKAWQQFEAVSLVDPMKALAKHATHRKEPVHRASTIIILMERERRVCLLMHCVRQYKEREERARTVRPVDQLSWTEAREGDKWTRERESERNTWVAILHLAREREERVCDVERWTSSRVYKGNHYITGSTSHSQTFVVMCQTAGMYERPSDT